MTEDTFQVQSDYARRLRAEGEAKGFATSEEKSWAKGWAKGWSTGEAKGWATGLAEGWADAVLVVLDTRGFHVPDDVRDRVTACSDLDQLKIWVRRAATGRTVDEVGLR